MLHSQSRIACVIGFVFSGTHPLYALLQNKWDFAMTDDRTLHVWNINASHSATNQIQNQTEMQKSIQITTNQQRRTLAGKKKKPQTTFKNILAQPFPRYW